MARTATGGPASSTSAAGLPEDHERLVAAATATDPRAGPGLVALAVHGVMWYPRDVTGARSDRRATARGRTGLRHAALAGLLATTILSGGCATLINSSLPPRTPQGAVQVPPVETTDCMRTSAARKGFGYAPLDEPVTDPDLLRDYLDDVPMDVRETARAAGLERILAMLLRAQATATDDTPVSLVAMRLQVVMRISSLEIQLASLLFEVECTDAQVEEVLQELDRRARRRELAFTIASIAAGALIGVGAGAWDLSGTASKGPAALGIAAGITTAGLGIIAFVPKRRQVIFPHAHNLFVPIVRGEDPERLYPPFVFRLLTTPRAPGNIAPRELLLAAWKDIIADTIPAEDRRLAEAVLYGRGGVYDGALVDARERMIDVLESQLNSFDQDLETLYRYFGRLLDLPSAPSAGRTEVEGREVADLLDDQPQLRPTGERGGHDRVQRSRAPDLVGEHRPQ